MLKKDNKVFFPNLDGLRFFCFLSVFFFHSFATDYEGIRQTNLYRGIKQFLFANGNLGVNFFFVLSGFLITYLLISEKEKFRKISIGKFYLRRILRIWPLFYFCVFFGFVLFPIVKKSFGEIPNETAHPLFYIFFLNNFDFIKHGLPDSSVLSILWSVAVEEQFYFVWPILVALIPQTKIKFLFLFIIAGSLLFRIYYMHNPMILEHHTFSCISDMAVGGYFGYLSFYKPAFLNRIKSLGRAWWILLYTITVTIFLFRKEIFLENTFLIALDRLAISLLFVLIILEQNYASHSLYKMSQSKTISIWGVYTYGLYCLHMIGILIAAKGLGFLGLNRNVYQVIFLEGGLSLLITMALAYVSYHFFEKRFLRLKQQFTLIKTSNTPVNPGTEFSKLKAKASV